MKKRFQNPLMLILLVCLLLLMAVHYFVMPFPDWAVRATGIAMIADVAWFGYSLGRRPDKRAQERNTEEQQNG